MLHILCPQVVMRNFPRCGPVKQTLYFSRYSHTGHSYKRTILGGILGCFEPGFEPDQHSHPGGYSWLIVVACINDFCTNSAIRTTASDHCAHQVGACRRHVDCSGWPRLIDTRPRFRAPFIQKRRIFRTPVISDCDDRQQFRKTLILFCNQSLKRNCCGFQYCVSWLTEYSNRINKNQFPNERCRSGSGV